MENSRFDVVVSDLMMPGLDGAQLMNEVRTRYPLSSRVIISLLGDEEKVARCLEDTHQFIAKPFDVKLLKATLARICSLDAYLNDEKLRTLVGKLGTLPSFPSLYGEIMKEFGSPGGSVMGSSDKPCFRSFKPRTTRNTGTKFTQFGLYPLAYSAYSAVHFW